MIDLLFLHSWNTPSLLQSPCPLPLEYQLRWSSMADCRLCITSCHVLSAPALPDVSCQGWAPGAARRIRSFRARVSRRAWTSMGDRCQPGECACRLASSTGAAIMASRSGLFQNRRNPPRRYTWGSACVCLAPSGVPCTMLRCSEHAGVFWCRALCFAAFAQARLFCTHDKRSGPPLRASASAASIGAIQSLAWQVSRAARICADRNRFGKQLSNLRCSTGAN